MHMNMSRNSIVEGEGQILQIINSVCVRFIVGTKAIIRNQNGYARSIC